ncbi:MAG: ABC transporter ATP-binding protein [Firmicutes bacterium]|nr:ABC transporter ATP-binding protein [Bacillota bacterium]
MPESVSIENVSKVYAKSKYALQDVSFELDPGKFLVLLGPSGSGKTTLLRSIAGIEKITKGGIFLSDRCVANEKIHISPNERNLSMVFQDYALWPHLSVLDNVAFAMKRYGLKKDDRQRAAQEVLDKVGLISHINNYPGELSGGEQQRVALARALVGKTGLLLFDEPLSNLDADLRDRLRIEISMLTREMAATSIYITHDQSEAFALADVIGVLESGRLVQMGTPEEIYSSPATPFVARFTGLAGEVCVKVDHCLSDNSAVVRGLTENAKPFIALGNGMSAGQSGRVMVRPAAVQLCAITDEKAHLSAIIKDVAFRGHGYEHAVMLEDGNQFANILSHHKHVRGTKVGLIFNFEGCILFPDTKFDSEVLDLSA